MQDKGNGKTDMAQGPAPKRVPGILFPLVLARFWRQGSNKRDRGTPLLFVLIRTADRKPEKADAVPAVGVAVRHQPEELGVHGQPSGAQPERRRWVCFFFFGRLVGVAPRCVCMCVFHIIPGRPHLFFVGAAAVGCLLVSTNWRPAASVFGGLQAQCHHEMLGCCCCCCCCCWCAMLCCRVRSQTNHVATRLMVRHAQSQDLSLSEKYKKLKRTPTLDLRFAFLLGTLTPGTPLQRSGTTVGPDSLVRQGTISASMTDGSVIHLVHTTSYLGDAACWSLLLWRVVHVLGVPFHRRQSALVLVVFFLRC